MIDVARIRAKVRRGQADFAKMRLAFRWGPSGIGSREGGLAFGEMTIQGIAEDDCRHFPLLNVFNAMRSSAE